MKVFELMTRLAKLPSGADVSIAENGTRDAVEISDVDGDCDYVTIIGNLAEDEAEDEDEE